MWLLTLTICVASNQGAQCRAYRQHFPDVIECIAMSHAHSEYAKAAAGPGKTIIYAGMSCEPGTDS